MLGFLRRLGIRVVYVTPPAEPSRAELAAADTRKALALDREIAELKAAIEDERVHSCDVAVINRLLEDLGGKLVARSRYPAPVNPGPTS